MQQHMLGEYLLQTVGTYLEPRSASIFRNLNKHHRTVLFPTLVKLLVQSTFGRWRGTLPATLAADCAKARRLPGYRQISRSIAQEMKKDNNLLLGKV